MILRKAEKNEYPMIARLYKEAFPPEERAPFFVLKRRALRGRGDMLVAEEDGRFLGFIYTVCSRDLVYLFFFAVSPEYRGGGYGTKILGQIKERYSGKRIFLAREDLDETAENYQQRVSRRGFYMRNGFSDMPRRIKEASVVYDVMGIGGVVEPEEYGTLMHEWMGWPMRCLVDVRMLNDEA